MNRYLSKKIKEDLKNKMVFLGGPRQVGKTTLALQLLDSKIRESRANELHPAYFNWDDTEDQARLLSKTLPGDQKLIILDELHKYMRWRNFLKGLYDKTKSERSYLVTGSARLDYYRRGGDSLQGRYHYWRLHPLSFVELGSSANQDDLEQLLNFGGFPEPFFKANTKHWRRWQKERRSRVIREDLIDLEKVNTVSSIDLLANKLPNCVGSPLSIKNLSQDLSSTYPTIKHWIEILERLYYCFRIYPYGAPKIKAVKKEAKLYLWDWSLCDDKGSRFENFVASSLLKYCHFKEDSEGYDMELRYIRDKQGKEIDFIVLQDQKPLFAVECKSGANKAAPALRYFSERLKIPQYFQIHMGQRHDELVEAPISIMPYTKFARKVLGV